MSLFRPDIDFAPAQFVPAGFDGAVNLATEEVQGAFAVSVADSGEWDARVEYETAAMQGNVELALDAAAVAELEQAAFDRGAESARADAERLTSACDALEGAAKKWESVTRAAVQANRELMLSLASQVAGRWVGSELAEAPEALARMLGQALEVLPADEPVRISLCPDDLTRLESEVPEQLAGWRERTSLKMLGKDDLSRGEYRLDSASASLDGRVDAVIAHVREALEGALEAPNPGGIE